MVFNREQIFELAHNLIHDEVSDTCEFQDDHDTCVETLGLIRGICEMTNAILSETDQTVPMGFTSGQE